MPSRTMKAGLTDRELDVLELLGMSFSMGTIGKVLGISPGTVKWHLKNIYDKFEGSGREQVLSRARALGLIHPVLPGRAPYEVSRARESRLRALARQLDAVTAKLI